MFFLLRQQGQFRDESEVGIILSENGTIIGSLTASLNFTKPEMACTLKFKHLEIDAYCGLEKPNRIHFYVRSSGLSSQDYFKASAELSPNGQVLKSEIRWKPESFYEIVNVSLNCLKLSAPRRHLVAFTRVAEGIAHRILMEATQDVRSSIDFDPEAFERLVGSLRSNLKTLYVLNLEYLDVCVEMLCDFLSDAIKSV